MTPILLIKTLAVDTRAGSGPRIAVFGDSHTAALLRAQHYSKRSQNYEHIRVLRLRKNKGEKVVGDVTLPALKRELQGFGPDDLVISAVGGNQYAIVSTVQDPVDYDLLASPRDETFRADAQLIPFRSMAAYIQSGIQESVLPLLREVSSLTSARMLHLVPPPPKSDNEFIIAHADGYFAKKGLRELGPTRPELRLKCWEVQLKVLADVCGELGIGLLMPPPKAVTSDGYLDPNCYAEDVTHANRRYGEAVLRQIIKVSKSKARAKRSA